MRMEWLGYPAQQSNQDVDISELPLNHAWVIANTSIENVSIYSVRDDCFNCPYKIEKHLTPNQLDSWKVEVGHLVSWRIVTDAPEDHIKLNYKKGWICQMRPSFKEYGVYRLDIGNCQVRPELPLTNTYYPLLLFSLVLLGICTIYTSVRYLWRKRREQKEVKETLEKGVQIEDIKEETASTLDVYRGMLLALIIFLTTGGGGYSILTDDWGGLTVAECLLFAFIWSVGFRIPTVMAEAFKEQTKCAIVRDIFVRSFFLILLGTAIDSTVEDQHSNLRLWSPLQKIGIAYFITACAYLLTVQRFTMKSKNLICKAVVNLVTLLWCWIIVGFLFSILAILISTFASFNCLGNINLHDIRAEELNISDGESLNCNNYVTEYANKILVGESLKMINVNQYFGFSRGVVGVISAITYMMIGLKSGVVYLNHQAHSDRIKLWCFWAVVFNLGGICFAVASYPLNFNLWPISSILFVSVTATYIFVLFYIVTEVLKFSSSLLSSLGVTSLVILCGHMLFSNTLPFRWGIYFNNHLVYLIQNLWIVLLWLIVAVLLKKRDVHFDM